MPVHDKRERILAAALELFAEQGFHGAPTSAIAARAGIGVGTIYRYFKDKDDLIQQLFRQLHQSFRLRLTADLSPEQPVRARFITIFSRLLRLFIDAPQEFRFMEQYYYSPYGSDCHVQVPEEEEVVRQPLAEARCQGLIKDAPMEVLERSSLGG